MRFLTSGKKEVVYISPEKLKLKKAINCVWEKDKITTGPGFEEKEEPVFHTDDASPYEMSFMLTDCYITYKERYGRIGVNKSENLFGYIAYNVIFISEDGKALPLGAVEFARNGEAFASPGTLTFFSGSKTVGDGIYMIYRLDYDSQEDFIAVREYSAEDDRWVMVTDSDIYAPTVLEYGRGESYHFAEVGGNPLRFPNPTNPEPKNMLSPRFISKFTTDGASFGFSLPYTKLDDALIKAKITLSGKEYEFKIYSDVIKSDYQSVLDDEVIMYCDRGFGRVYFMKKSGGEWIPPFSSEYNNLTVLAYKTIEGHRERVSSMSSAKKLPGSAVTGGQSVTIFWGSRVSPASVILNSPTNPLYFPVNSEYTLGEELEISNIISVGKYLYVFKAGDVYRSEIKPVGERANYPLSFSLATELSASPAKNTVVRLFDDILFADEFGGIYCLSAGGNYNCKRIKSFGFGFDFAISLEDKCLFIKGNSAVLVWQGAEGAVFGQWSLPLGCVGALYSSGQALFLFEKRDEWQYDIVAASLTSKGSSAEAVLGFDVLSDMGRVRLCSASLFGEGGDFTLTLYADDKKLLKRKGSLRQGREKLLLGAFSDNMRAELCFKESFSLEKIKFEYITKGAL